ncbi:MAG: hypothetical protein IH963_06730, partial [Chloroflexi bacterium]|nr:hypothetical protein [Chloroflexota bacterium]
MSLEDGIVFLDLVRKGLVESHKRDVVFEVGVDHAYGTWALRHLAEQEGGIHQLAEDLMRHIESSPERDSPTEKMALMNAITSACARLLMRGQSIPRSESPELRESSERKLTESAQRSYQNRIGLATGEFWALGYLAETPQPYLDASRKVLMQPGGARAVYDILNGMSALARRGLLNEDPERTAAIDLARDLIPLCWSAGQFRAFRDFARTARARELASDLRGLSAKIGKRDPRLASE